MADDARPVTRGDLADALAPLKEIAADVKQLREDHVTHGQFEALRKEMRDSFTAADSRYMPREMSDMRYAELAKRLDFHDMQFKELHDDAEDRAEAEREHGWQFGNNLVTWLITFVLMATAIGALVVSIITLTRTH